MHVIIKDVLLNTKTPKILAGGLALLLVLEWGVGVHDARQLEHVTEPRNPPHVKIAEPVKQPKQHKAVHVDLFGTYTPDGVEGGGIEQSKLNASIIGILYSSDEKASQVLLDVPGHANQVFSVGDTIPGGAKIKRITPEGILLMRSGKMESLSLPKKKLDFAPPPQPMGER
ncbi:MAG: type II secretion system protein N [Legionellaceae bacterium]|nr:type II secretion system protein N [Legionellaceae bacterium]